MDNLQSSQQPTDRRSNTADLQSSQQPTDRRLKTADELLERLLDLAVRIGRIADALPDTRLGRHVAGQIIRCGTSPAPNYAEGCAAESRDDFIHKLSVSLKELRETRCWLRLIEKADLLSPAMTAD